MTDDESYESEEDLSNDQWFKENYLQLIQDYPNQWIAVVDRRIVARGNIRSRVQADAEKIAGDKLFSLYFIEPSGMLP